MRVLYIYGNFCDNHFQQFNPANLGIASELQEVWLGSGPSASQIAVTLLLCDNLKRASKI